MQITYKVWLRSFDYCASHFAQSLYFSAGDKFLNFFATASDLNYV